MFPIEQSNEWLVQRRYVSEQSIKLVLSTEPGTARGRREQQQQQSARP
jgi:hypothetical protein